MYLRPRILIFTLCLAAFVVLGLFIWKMHELRTSLKESDERVAVLEKKINDVALMKVQQTTNPQEQTQNQENPVKDGKVLLSGIYRTYSLDWWKAEYGQDITCNAFEVLSGDSALIEKYVAMVKRGNGVNRLSENGHLIINLPWDELNTSQQEYIRNATVENPANITVTEKLPSNTGAGPCHSFFSM